MQTLLNKVITHLRKHPKQNLGGHSHTTWVITTDGQGHHWQEVICHKKDCEVVDRVSVLKEQIEAWERSGEIITIRVVFAS